MTDPNRKPSLIEENIGDQNPANDNARVNKRKQKRAANQIKRRRDVGCETETVAGGARGTAADGETVTAAGGAREIVPVVPNIDNVLLQNFAIIHCGR